MCDKGCVLVDTLRVYNVPVSLPPSQAPCPQSPQLQAGPQKMLVPGEAPLARDWIAGATGTVEDQSLALFYFTNQRAEVAALLLLQHS